MSMKYYAVDDYGMVLDEETAKIICLKLFDDYKGEDYGYDLYENGNCEMIVEFDGEAQELQDDGTINWCGYNKSYYEDTIYYIPLSKYPTLFKGKYNNMNEIISELKNRVGRYLPDDFDYRSRICHICGTYFG